MRLIGILLAAVWALAELPCLGQEAIVPSADAASTAVDELPPANTEPPTLAIAPEDVISQAAEVAIRLQEFEANVLPSTVVANLALDFSKQAQALADLRTELSSLNSANTTPRQLEEQRREWTQLGGQIDGWMQRADDRWRSLQTSRDEVGELLKRWETTREANLDSDMPAELKRRVDQIIAQLQLLQGEFRPRMDQVAEVIERLADARTTTTNALSQLGKLTESVNRRLFNRDAPALWQTQKAEWLALDDTTRESTARWFRDIRNFFTDHPVLLLIHLLLFLGLLSAILIAWQSSRDWPEGAPELDRARFLVSRPVSVALAFAIPVGYFMYGPLPAAARDCFYLLILIPILRLAAGLSAPWERAGIYGLLVLSGVLQLVQFFPQNSLLFRILLLVIEISTAVVIGYAIRSVCARDDRQRRWLGSITLLVYSVVLISMLFALVANVLGWVHLSQYFTEGTLLTGKGAILAILIVRAGAGLLPSVLRYGPARALLSVRHHPVRYERAGITVLSLLLFFIWSRETLRRFRLSDQFADQLETMLSTPLAWAELNITLGHLLKALLIVVATFMAQRLMRFLLDEEIFPRLRMRTSATALFATLLKYAIVAIGIGMAFSALGFTATQLTVMLGALSVGIGFGLQNIVSNFVSGLILMFERPIKIGDIVEVGANRGRVKNIGVRATSVETFEGAEVVVPNADLISKEVINWTLSDSTARVEVVVGVAYGSNLHEVLEILVRAAKRNEHVFVEPEPFAMMFGFAESALNFRLLCWTSIDNRGIVTSQVHIAVYEALADAGVEVPFPQLDLRVRSADHPLAEFDKISDLD